MLYIKKTTEPPELVTHRLQGRDYEAMGNKKDADGQEIRSVRDIVLDALLHEQGHLCAYCMRRITAENMQIEHRLSQKRMPEQAVIYSNFLGVCSGKIDKSREMGVILHCDKQKSTVHDNVEKEKWIALHTNPNNETQMNTIYYTSGSGKIHSTDTQIEDEINRILNLNNDIIRRNRANTVVEIIQKLGKKWVKSEIQKQLNDWSSTNKNGQFRPYYGIAIAYLTKKSRNI